MVWVAYHSTYARPTPGLRKPSTEHLDSGTLARALPGAGILCVFLGWRGVAAFGLVLAYTRWLKVFFHRRLGGITGDVLGFAEESGEAFFLLVLHLLA
jgi:adenosylcobinamide-GDP ribazoletransferase